MRIGARSDTPVERLAMQQCRHPNRASSFSVGFFAWHNYQHRHSGIGYHTPASVYHRTAAEIRQHRTEVLNRAFAAHPEGFVAGRPTPPELPEIVYINPPKETTSTH